MIKSIGDSWKLTMTIAAVAAVLYFSEKNVEAQTTPPAGVTAVSANDFLNSLSVCTHIAISGQAWDLEPSVEPCITYLGVRNIRDTATTNSTFLQDFITLHANTGAQVCLSPWGQDVPPLISALEQLNAAGALLAIEGPNEPNNFGCTYQGQSATGTVLTTTTAAVINNAASNNSIVYANNSTANRSYGPVSFTYGTASTPFVTGETTLGVLRSNISGWVGFKFTVGSSPIVVNQVGRWVVAGNTGTHNVRIVNVATGATVGMAAVKTAGAPAGAFAYAALATPVTLAANTTYYIMSQEGSGWDQWCDGEYNEQPVAYFQRDLYSAVKADPKLAGVPVFSAPMAGGSEPLNNGLQFLTIPTGAGTLMPDGTVYADFANNHNYVSGIGRSNLPALLSNNAWDAEDPLLETDWDGLYGEFGVTWAAPHFTGYSATQLQTLPRVTTETGWVTQGANAITQDQQGKLFLNLYLDAFKRGWSFTSIYMLRDCSGGTAEGYWGLFDVNYLPKLSATYVHNLTTLLADTTPITPGALNYSIANEPATVHDMLIEKSNGMFELVVWDENVSGSDNVTVNLGSSFATVKIYDPTVSTVAGAATITQTLINVSSVSLTLSDHPLIIELPMPIPSSIAGFTGTDIGSVGTAGSDSYNPATGVYTVSGAGAEISGTADAFHYVCQTLQGDGSLSARVASVQNTNAYAKAGIMVRQSTDAGAITSIVYATPGAGIDSQYRTDLNGSMSAISENSASTAPYWLKVVKTGTVITMYRSPDGTTWSSAGSVTLTSLTNPVKIGFAVCSHSTAVLCTATFDHINFSTSFTGTDIGSVGVAGTDSYNPTTAVYTLSGAGSNIYDTADSCHYVYQTLPGDGQLQARVTSVSDSASHAKAGVMIRQNTAPGALEYSALIEPYTTSSMAMVRQTASGSTTETAASAVNVPYWLKVIKSGTILTSYESPDGITWTPIRTASVPFSGPIEIGLAVSSTNTSALCTATFDNITLQSNGVEVPGW